MGETHLAARNYPAALDNLDRTLRLDPDQPAALFYKGLAYAATADTSTAVQYLQDALARDPRQPEILHQLAFLLNAWRMPAEAARYAAHWACGSIPPPGRLRYDYGRQLELQGRPDSALWYYRRALALDTTVYRADYRLGLAAARARQPAAVIQHLQRALRRNPRLPEARALLAEALKPRTACPKPWPSTACWWPKTPATSTGPSKSGKRMSRCRPHCPTACAPARATTTAAGPARLEPVAPLPTQSAAANQ